MHGFTAAFVSQLGLFGEHGRKMLCDVVERGALLASGFGEGRSGAGLFEYQTRGVRDGASFRLNGRKRPCTLARDMDYLTLGFSCQDSSESPQPSIAMIPADNPGLRTNPFWKAPVLSAAGSEEVVLENVVIPAAMAFAPAADADAEQSRMRTTEALGLGCFQILLAASYVGMATALIERLIARREANQVDVVDAYTQIEGAMMCLEGAARRLDDSSPPTASLLAEVMAARFLAQGCIQRGVDLALEMLGGKAYMMAPEVAMIGSAVRCLAFHPLNRGHALGYIAELRARVTSRGSGHVTLEECLAPGLEGTEFERFFHQRNLDAIEAKVFSF